MADTLKIATIVGARPQFIKAAPVSTELAGHQEVLIHTGQHYDYGMSEIFFEELGLRAPDYNLGVGSASHGAQTGQMLARIEEVLVRETPDCVIVYGDTNSTLAGALAAAKLHIPVVHVEAGLRSFNLRMPEEINRVLTDRVSTLLFVPSDVARQNLYREGIREGIHDVGDIMLDATLLHARRAAQNSTIAVRHGLGRGDYFLCTIHRAENTDNRDRLAAIIDGVGRLSSRVIFPIHPRTAQQMRAWNIEAAQQVITIDPVGYLDMLALQSNAACVVTDSGGIQKEAFYLGVPCVTVRDETEWVETVSAGWNRLCAAEPVAIQCAVTEQSRVSGERPQLYGTGDAAGRIVAAMEQHFEGTR